jgi:hypothetical protein
MKGVFRRDGDKLIPVDDSAKEALLAIKDGSKCMGEIRGARNLDQHRLYWALCQLVAEADDDTKENVKKWLCIKCNHVDIWFEPDGKMHVDPASIAYESMPQAEFNQMFQEAVHHIAARLGCKETDVQTKFAEMTGARN